VKNGFTLAMIGLMLMTEPPLLSTESQNLEADCENADFTTIGRPVMFTVRDGIAFGISTPRTTLGMGDAVLIYVWVNNQTDKEKVLGSCQMWWDWGITVYDSQWHEVKTHSEQEQERKRQQPFNGCVRNVALRIPPHSCGPLQDMGNVKVDLREDRDLPAGEYLVTEKRLKSSETSLVAARPVGGLKIVITDKKTQFR